MSCREWCQEWGVLGGAMGEEQRCRDATVGIVVATSKWSGHMTCQSVVAPDVLIWGARGVQVPGDAE